MGEFLAATAGPIDRIVSSLHSELVAMRCAVGLIKSCYLDDVRVNFEGDSSVVLEAMKGKGEDYSIWGSVINYLRFFLLGLPNLECSHVWREGNLAVHRLARMGLGVSQELVWFEEPPFLIQDILFEEGL
ncbi:uncharacterized protein LOC126633942 [Malus sylvestris]|uniref:uncharacterized protein LOC126633942 n=1 Tax=Malus sylvestris TaxID=3752 RepID=UPI0021AC18BB|nr:uncharacterized protein LOC126633942 [Malus sylvestris]